MQGFSGSAATGGGAAADIAELAARARFAVVAIAIRRWGIGRRSAARAAAAGRAAGVGGGGRRNRRSHRINRERTAARTAAAPAAAAMLAQPAIGAAERIPVTVEQEAARPPVAATRAILHGARRTGSRRTAHLGAAAAQSTEAKHTAHQRRRGAAES